MKVLKSRVVRLFAYICLIASFIFISGCSAKESSIISSPAGSVSQGAILDKRQKTEKNADWLPDKIVPFIASDWQKAIDENKNYLYILDGQNVIVQIDKKTRESVPVVQCKKEDIISFLIAEDEYLYYQINENAIYRYDLLKGNSKQIYYTEERDSIFGLQVYKNNTYLYQSGLIISKFNPKTKEQKILLENVIDPIFVDNKLFYMKRRDVSTIYSINLETEKKETIRKLKNKKKKRFGNLFQYNGKLCYTIYGDQGQICMLSDQGRDTTLVKAEPEQIMYPVYSREKDTLYYICQKDIHTDGDRAYLGIYKEGKNREIQLPKDYKERGCVGNGYFFYEGCDQNEGGEDDYYCTYINIKNYLKD